MQAQRLDNNEDSLVKRTTINEHSSWKQMMKQIMHEYHLEDKHQQVSKYMMKKLLDHIKNETFQQIATDAQNKTNDRQWKENHRISKRAKYMERLTKKLCSAILWVRVGMLPIKANKKSQYKEGLTCRFCRQHDETKDHTLPRCLTTPSDTDAQDLNRLRMFADHIMATERIMEGTT